VRVHGLGKKISRKGQPSKEHRVPSEKIADAREKVPKSQCSRYFFNVKSDAEEQKELRVRSPTEPQDL